MGISVMLIRKGVSIVLVVGLAGDRGLWARDGVIFVRVNLLKHTHTILSTLHTLST